MGNVSTEWLAAISTDAITASTKRKKAVLFL